MARAQINMSIKPCTLELVMTTWLKELEQKKQNVAKLEAFQGQKLRSSKLLQAHRFV